MITFVQAVEYMMYGLSAIGIATATYGLFSVGRAFYRKDYLLLRDDTPKTKPPRSTHT